MLEFINTCSRKLKTMKGEEDRLLRNMKKESIKACEKEIM